jgi:osmoprotectant transport system ATP-binding protein
MLESLELMKNRELDTAIVVDENDKFKGVVTIESIRERGKAGEEIIHLAKSNVPTVLINTSAKDSFDILIESKMEYVVVLNRNGTVAGIITKTSMTKALASVVWGGEAS